MNALPPATWFATLTSIDGRVTLNGEATSAVGSTTLNEKLLLASLAALAESRHASSVATLSTYSPAVTPAGSKKSRTLPPPSAIDGFLFVPPATGAIVAL